MMMAGTQLERDWRRCGMAKYLVTWEMDTTKVPVNPKERAAAWGPMLDMVANDMKKGVIKDWGTHIGEMSGYGVAEGSEMEVAAMCQQYIPYVRFTLHPLMSLDQMRQMMQGLSK
jgi:hypothetical protein